VCALSLAPQLASADEAPLAAQVQLRVEDGLVKPLTAQEANVSRFSRVRRPPSERRVRVTQTAVSVDKAGRPFMAFAVDVKFRGGEWRENDLVGCAYTKSGDIFVKTGDTYRPASFFFGKTAEPVADVCKADVARS
jgi:hypothetical protein